MAEMVCVSCGRNFAVRPQSPKQKFCSMAACQRERRRRWAKDKLRSDPDYRANQLAAQRAWHSRNPGYWKAYRGRSAPPAQKSPSPARGATSDASVFGVDIAAGLCWIEIYTAGSDGGSRAWRIELSLKVLPNDCNHERVQTEDRMAEPASKA